MHSPAKSEKQKQDPVALSCEKPLQTCSGKGLLGLSGEAGKYHDFSLRLCVSARC